MWEETCQLSPDVSRLDTLDDPYELCFDPISYFEVIWGQVRFLPLTFDSIEIGHWGRFYVLVPIDHWGWSLVETHQLICSMAYLGHHVTSCDLDLSSKFDFDLLRWTCICFYASRRGKHHRVRFSPIFLFVQKYTRKPVFTPKKVFWPFLNSIASIV